MKRNSSQLKSPNRAPTQSTIKRHAAYGLVQVVYDSRGSRLLQDSCDHRCHQVMRRCDGLLLELTAIADERLALIDMLRFVSLMSSRKYTISTSSA